MPLFSQETGGFYGTLLLPAYQSSSLIAKIILMSKAEIIAELSRLSPEDRAEIQAKLDELTGDEWEDAGELSDADKRVLDTALKAYEKSPNAGSSWDEVKARVQAKLRP
jgi:hypothetical protein